MTENDKADKRPGTMTTKKTSATSRKTRNSDLEAAVRRALAGGAQPEDVINLVTVVGGDAVPAAATIRRMVHSLRKELALDRQPKMAYAYPGSEKTSQGFLDPENLPEGAVLLKDIARQLSISPKTIHHWIRSGRMEEIGRVGGKGSGTGGFVVVRRADVLRCHSNPGRGGRPRKTAPSA